MILTKSYKLASHTKIHLTPQLFVKTHDENQLLGPELTTENACSRPSNITISSKTLMRTLAFMCTSSCCVERCIVLLDNIVAILMALSSTSVNVLAYARQGPCPLHVNMLYHACRRVFLCVSTCFLLLCP